MKAEIIDFHEWKARPTERVEPKTVQIKEGKAKKAEELYVRRHKATHFINHINAKHWHKFSYPLLASRFPKDVHSFEVLASHIFSVWGTILDDNDFPISQPGIWFAKQEAYARDEEIISFLAWRLRKYHECASYYGYDIKIIEEHIEAIHVWHQRFETFFILYGTEQFKRRRTIHAI